MSRRRTAPAYRGAALASEHVILLKPYQEVSVRKRSAYVAVTMACALVLAACSSSDEGSFLDQSAGTSADAEDPFSLDDLPTDVGDLPGVSGECEALLNLFLSIGGAFLGGEVSSLNSDALANLPAEIRNDALVVSETLAEFSAGLQDLGVDLSDPSSVGTLTEAQQQAFGALSESMDSDRFNAAADNLSAYGEQQCEDQFGPLG